MAGFASQAIAQTVQTAGDVFDGRAYLWVEAEDYSALGEDPEGDGFVVVSKETPITSVGGLDILPATSNVSGTALFDRVGGGGHTDTATYEVSFITAGTYQLYTRHTMYDVDGNGIFGNEDSVYFSPAFNLDSLDGWIGFAGPEFDDAVGDIPNPGFALDPNGFAPSEGDSPNDGWYAMRDWGVKSEGTVDFNNDASTDFWNGNFHWYNRPAFVATNPSGGFFDEYGFKTEYVVTEEQVGQTLTFEIATREPYGAFDGFLFIQDDEVNLLDMFSQDEVTEGILSGGGELVGDLNDDGAVNFGDLTPFVTALTDPAAYETMFPGVDRVARCDTSGDAMCNFGDLTPFVELLTSAGSGSAAVPEPTSAWLVAVALLALIVRRRV
jgi:hypothetical protein